MNSPSNYHAVEARPNKEQAILDAFTAGFTDGCLRAAHDRGFIYYTLGGIRDCCRRHGAGKRDAGREESGGDLISHLQGQGTTPSQGAMRIEDQARVIEALQRLPEKYRLVLQMRFYDGLPFEEVAQKVGVMVGNARVLMVRAIEKLKNEFGAEHES